MSDLLPKSEVATSDDLIDFFARIRDAKSGKKKQAWQKEFDAHRTEFESKLHAFVDKLLTEAVCDVCGEEVGDRWFADKARSGQKVAICGRCYLQDISGEHSTDVPHDFPGSTDVDPDFPNDQELDNEGPPLRYPDYDQARLGRTQARRLQSDPPLVRPPGV